MTRTIQLTKQGANSSDLGGQKEKVVAAIHKLGGNVEFKKLKSRLRMQAKTLRARVRELRQMKLVSVKAIAA